uniref:Agmatinase n=1 Tax=Grammatophora oceanica TaxID=210454 RepID=A0A7S1VBP4_9STRA|mmetsp:Transcript_42237/g.62557  ORF Transcript_42237/g.62557 Transcript_42237/m.62557 type:complete len:414 (+) Transcript_42237:139-1380(+)|eukprot:CAMPEP_0194049508 /NCGR_PEP_ID=MMETSP0009_2-20130614/30722_1 /TAXON_ID=210454 /ORGANISM="Grammatophora oceanica, Strain CCMP 410" /LENGTH=413 /DNA_ID=CAMNT_0038695685 /DNA_START=52 /DNA_END=1293 /DNA_ORIENTATION=+
MIRQAASQRALGRVFRRSATKAAATAHAQQTRSHHPDPFNPKTTKGWAAAKKEATIPTTKADEEIQHGLEFGLPGASSINDKTIPTFSRGELPHFAGINTFLKAPYVEDVREVGQYDAAVLGVPFDGGCTYRSGTRFGPQGIRRISALYTPYNYEKGIDLREQMTLCDIGDVFTIPANIEKSFDQISNAVAHVASSGTLPIILGGDHSIGFPTVRGLASVTSKNIGIIHVDRHADIQEFDLDERMHTTPYFHATNIPNVKPKNLVQIGIGGWQVPRPAVPNMIERETNIFTMEDIEQHGIEKIAEMALERAWDGTDAVYMSYDIDSIEAAFVPGTGWPEPGGLLPREALKLVGLVAAEGLCGMEVVEVSPPYDHADITSLMALRIVVDALGSMVSHGTIHNFKDVYDKPFVPI